MHSQALNQLIVWQATISNAAARLRRPKVTAVLCQSCRKWVKPRRWNPDLYACNRCAPAVAHDYYRARCAAADQAADQVAAAQQRALDKHIRQWRRHAAHLTGAG